MMIIDYVGIPYLLHGADRAGVDCWGIVRMFYREQYAIDLPSFGDRYGRELDEAERAQIAAIIRGESGEWWRVPEGEEKVGDLLLLRMLGEESHLGVVTAPGCFLHARQGIGSCVERYDHPAWARRVVAFYRWAAWQ